MPQKSPKLRLDELLVVRGLAETRSQAQRLVLAGEVMIGDALADKPGRLVPEDADLRVRETMRYVSRGGLKLEAALDAFAIVPEGWICADIGASTGGFTDCLLQRGAARVYAIDVGYGQLAWSLRQDPRVVTMERTNVRHVDSLPDPIRLATVDVSFIGLDLVLPRLASFLEPSGEVIALIKPQFEVGKGRLGKGGVVREPSLHREVLLRVLELAAQRGLPPAGLIRSPITGPAGNVEFLTLLRRGGEAQPQQYEGWLSASLDIPASQS
jgi:23S rRNA (cytidine1920-2'-O)/16S rRNA (cytidine1409-2'-O)-methyltransferase